MHKRLVIASLICTALFLALSRPALPATRTALVIGNGAYATAPLANPRNDALDVAKTLRSLNFDVIERIDASHKEMESAIDAFYKRLTHAEVGVFYFAGHGMQIGGISQIPPLKGVA